MTNTTMINIAMTNTTMTNTAMTNTTVALPFPPPTPVHSAIPCRTTTLYFLVRPVALFLHCLSPTRCAFLSPLEKCWTAFNHRSTLWVESSTTLLTPDQSATTARDTCQAHYTWMPHWWVWQRVWHGDEVVGVVQGGEWYELDWCIRWACHWGWLISGCGLVCLPRPSVRQCYWWGIVQLPLLYFLPPFVLTWYTPI